MYNNLADILNGLVALSAAAVSVFTLIKYNKESKPNILVTYGWRYPSFVFGKTLPTTNTPSALVLIATNFGRQYIIVSTLSLEIPLLGACIVPSFVEEIIGKKSKLNKDADQDVRLNPGEKLSTTFDYSQIIEVLERNPRRTTNVSMPTRVRAQCEDTLENFFHSSWIQIPHD